MKVYIGPYLRWIGPYQIAEAICFWTKKDLINGNPDYVHNLGTWLNENKNGDKTWLSKFCSWIFEKRKRKVKIKLHPYDTWNMDGTLAMLIVPMLKQLKGKSRSYGMVDMEDVPEELREEPNETHEYQYGLKRWHWVLDEMIWSFEQLLPDAIGDSQFFDHSEVDEKSDIIDQIHKVKIDQDGLLKYNDRIANGTRLFGKYYRNLWD